MGLPRVELSLSALKLLSETVREGSPKPVLPCCETPAPPRASVRLGYALAQLWRCKPARLFLRPLSRLTVIEPRRVWRTPWEPTRAPRFAWADHASDKSPRRSVSSRRSVPAAAIRWPCRRCPGKGADRRTFRPTPTDGPSFVPSRPRAEPASAS